jgi:hypothetical protein
MMLWLLATPSVVTKSWGMAHRLKDDSPTLERALSCEKPNKPEPNTSTSGEE